MAEGTHSICRPSGQSAQHHVDLFVAATGLFALALGAAVYLLVRPRGASWLIPAVEGGETVPLPGMLSGSLPVMLHVFAFSLLTAALLGPGLRRAGASCGSWLAINFLFELGQLGDSARWIARHFPAGWEGIPFLGRIPGYFLHGTFDPLDLLAATIGAALAWLVLMQRRRTVPDV